MDHQAAIEGISALYEKQLEVPSEKTVQPFLLCPVGLVGAGKTTVVKPLAKELGLVRISNDELRILLKGNNLTENQEEDVRAMAYSLIRKYFEKGYGIAIDANCSSKKELLKKMAAEANAPLIWIHIDPPEEFIIEKLENYKHGTLFKNADDAIEHYRRSKEEHIDMDKDIPYTYTFDTSKENLPRADKGSGGDN